MHTQSLKLCEKNYTFWCLSWRLQLSLRGEDSST